MNEKKHQKVGNGKMNGLLMLIELLMKKVEDYFVWIIIIIFLVLGFEYCVNQSLGGWSPTEKIFHLNRRRRWYRTRTIKAEKLAEQKKVLSFIILSLDLSTNISIFRHIFVHLLKLQLYLSQSMRLKWVLDLP